jgi:hypothetical protein
MDCESKCEKNTRSSFKRTFMGLIGLVADSQSVRFRSLKMLKLKCGSVHTTSRFQLTVELIILQLLTTIKP